MSIRGAARTFGLHRDTVSKMMAYLVPLGYLRKSPPQRPNPSISSGRVIIGVIDRILDDDSRRTREQCHTAKRIFGRVRDACGFDGGYTVVKG